jgi:TPR repeat protein
MCYEGQNFEEAREYIKRAADKGRTDAQYNYALMCYHAEGEDKNLEQARIYYKMAADQGDVSAKKAYEIICSNMNKE